MSWGKVLKEIFIIFVLSCIFGLVAHVSLLKRFVRGEFKEAFFSQEKYPGIIFITLAEAEDLYVKREAVFADSRSHDDYAAGHILGAVSVPLGEVKQGEIRAQLETPLEQMVVIYCNGGDCQESINLAKILSEKGYKNIKVFSGGWEKWKKAGLPEASGNGPQ